MLGGDAVDSQGTRGGLKQTPNYLRPICLPSPYEFLRIDQSPMQLNYNTNSVLKQKMSILTPQALGPQVINNSNNSNNNNNNNGIGIGTGDRQPQ